MNIKQRLLTRIVPVTILLLVVIAISVYRKGTFQVVITNRSAFTLMNVELNGDGDWTQQVADIPAGEKVVVKVRHAFDEPGFGIGFEAEGTEVATGDVISLEAGGDSSLIGFTIQENLDVDPFYYQD